MTGAMDRLQASGGDAGELTSTDLVLLFIGVLRHVVPNHLLQYRPRGSRDDPDTRRGSHAVGWLWDIEPTAAANIGLGAHIRNGWPSSQTAPTSGAGQHDRADRPLPGGGVWSYLTFFVVPVIVVEGSGPIGAIKRSSALFKKTWGEQFVANFGFGLLFVGAVILGVIPAFLVAQISPLTGIAVAVVTVGGAAAIVSSLEGIFKAALYVFAAEDVVSTEFSADALRTSYTQPGAARGLI